MKKLSLFIFLIIPLTTFGQIPETELPKPDTVVLRRQTVPVFDSTLVGRNIHEVMPAGVTVNGSKEVQEAETARREYNMGRSVQGFRIRIYFDNSQNARNISAATLESFRNNHPDIPAFRTFENSYFKVTVGNYRTRTDANRALAVLKSSFPTAFIVEEKLKYPDF